MGHCYGVHGPESVSYTHLSILGEDIKPVPIRWLLSEDGKSGLTARYYNSDHVGGEPVLTRIDRSIQFNWIYSRCV